MFETNKDQLVEQQTRISFKCSLKLIKRRNHLLLSQLVHPVT